MKLTLNMFFYAVLLLSISNTTANEFAYSSELKLDNALKSMPAGYSPRSRHLCNNQQPCYTNRLILEHSPYLLQHAHNPVDWHVWGKEALDKAKRENKIIFLSVGYAACHWCHVMEEESFDSLEISELLNKNFIAIKVDRERRPDIDEFYGSAMVLFQGQQGWPMSLFLTPDGRPFDGGGYYTRVKFKLLLTDIAERWRKQKQQVMTDAKQIMQQLNMQVSHNASAENINRKIRYRAIKDLLSITDNYNGGFGEASKFPREPWLSLLLNEVYATTEKDTAARRRDVKEDALIAVNNTLLHIAQGGIYDQLGGGFHRYTVDPYWKVPHFEKMLYNQALLLRLFLQANRLKPNLYYARVAQQTAWFLIHEMKSSSGGFYSSLDADSEGEEGRYYLWSVKQWQAILNDDSSWLAELYDVDEYGETDGGLNVLYLAYSFEEFSEEKKLQQSVLLEKVDKARQKLLGIRNQRVKPLIDKKIIMGWNGLVISALAEVSVDLKQGEYLQEAAETADFIWTEMRADKYFYRSQFNAKNSQLALLEDYAFYLQGLISLYDADKNIKWLERAEVVADMMFKLFWDNQQGGFFNAVENIDAPLPVRAKLAFDKTLPSGNAVAAKSLLMLSKRTGKTRYKDWALGVLSAFSAQVQETPSAYSGLLIVADEMQTGEKDLPVYAARGQLRIDAGLKRIDNQYFELKVNLSINNNWHINSSTPLEKYLIPTLLSISEQADKNNKHWKLEVVRYPQHELVKLGFSQKLLALYQRETQITARLKNDGNGLSPVVHLQLQACNNQLCLPPEAVVLYPHL